MSVIIATVASGLAMQIARYNTLAAEMQQAILPGSSPIEFKPGYVISEELGWAAINLYCALSEGIKAELNAFRECRYAPYLQDCLEQEVARWEEALKGDHLRRFGWVHRVINEMLGLARRNGRSELGEIEFDCIFEVVAANQYDVLISKPR